MRLFLFWLLRAGLLVCLDVSFAMSVAHAGAFLQPPGEGQVIASVRFVRADAGFDAGGRLKTGSFYSKSEIQAYAEYGLRDWMTIVFSPSILHLHVQNALPAGYSGVGDSELAARVRLLAYGPAVISLQAGGVARGDMLGFGHRGLTGKAAVQGDVRLLAGSGFACGPWHCFADAQIGYRPAASGAAGEIRADLTFGVRPMQSVLLMVQGFSSFAPGGVRVESHKLQVSAVYDLSKRLSFQLGVFTSILGRNAPRERGIISALWVRF